MGLEALSLGTGRAGAHAGGKCDDRGEAGKMEVVTG